MSSFLTTMDRALGRLYAACGVISAISIVLIAVLVAVSIISRALGIYVGGLTEGAGYAMATAGSFGLAYTFQAGGHIRVDLILIALTTRAQNIAEFIALLLTTSAIFYLAWFMLRMVRISYQFGDISDGSDGLPIWLPQFPAAVGFAIFAIALLHNFIRYCLTGQKPWSVSGDILSNEEKS